MIKSKNFKTFKADLNNGNTSGVVKYFDKSFLNKIFDEKKNNRPIHVACDKGFYEIVQFLVHNQCDMEQQTDDGWTALHFAASKGHLDVVRILVDHNCNLECEDKRGWRPIHLAGFSNHLNVLTLLINRGCDILSKTKSGKTALDYARFKQNEICVKFLEMSSLDKQVSDTGSKLSLKETQNPNMKTEIDNVIKNIGNPIDNKELLQYLDIIREIENQEEKNLMRECCLYRSIRHQNAEGFKIFSSPQTINRPRKLVQKSFLEIAVEFSSRGFIKDILQKTIYDKEVWDRAKKDAEQNNQMEILSEISDREFVLSSRKEANLSILHTAVCDNNPDMVKYILDNPDLADKDMNNPRIGTALAFAHMLHHKLCIDILEQYNVDANKQNKLLETSLHEAIASGMHMKCQYLIDNSVDIDRVNIMGVTALHFAVIKGFEGLCQKLLKKGADCTRYIETTDRSLMLSTIIEDPLDQPLTKAENALTLCIKIHRTIYSCFLENLDERIANSSDGELNTLLHLAVKSLLPSICTSLIKAGAEIDKMNERSNSPLMELLCNIDETILQEDFEEVMKILKILVDAGANVMKTTSSGRTIFYIARKLQKEKLMCILISSNFPPKYFDEDDFVEAFLEKWFDYAENLVKNLSDQFLLRNISKEIIRLCLEHNQTSLVKSLFDKADKNVQQSVLEDIIYHFAEIDEEEPFLYMVDKELICPRLFENGETLLTNLLLNKKFEFCRKVFRSVNCTKHLKAKNIKNQCPLQVAIDVGDINMIYDLVNESDMFNHEDDDGQTPLTKLFEKLSLCDDNLIEKELYSIIESIIRKGGKLYITTKTGKRVIDACSNSSIKTEIENYFLNMKRTQFYLN